MKLFNLFLFCLFFLFVGCLHTNEGTINQTFATDKVWAEVEEGKWRIINIDETKEGDIIDAKRIFQPIKEITVSGYKDAKEGASLITGRDQVNVNTGIAHEPPAPESSADRMFGWVIGITFGIGGIASIGAVVFGFFLQDRRIAGTLFLVGIVAVALGSGLLLLGKILAAIPVWLLITTFIVIVILIIGLGFGFGMKNGWIIHEKQTKKGDFS